MTTEHNKQLVCSARTCRNQLDEFDESYRIPSGSRGITWQELLIGTVQRYPGSMVVCSSHFSERQYVLGRTGHRQLSRNALPDVNILHTGTVCRFCMEPSKINMYSLFNQQPEVPSLEDIERTVNISIRQHDGLPEVACATCISKIRYIKRIQDQFQESDRKLRARLDVPAESDGDEPDMEEEYLLVDQQPPKPDHENFLLTADQLTIVEGAQEEIETTDQTPSREESPEPPPSPSPEKAEETAAMDCVMLFSGDIQESTAADNSSSSCHVEYEMTALSTGVGDSADEAANADSDDQHQEGQTNGNTYKPFRYSKRARRGDQRFEY